MWAPVICLLSLHYLKFKANLCCRVSPRYHLWVSGDSALGWHSFFLLAHTADQQGVCMAPFTLSDAVPLFELCPVNTSHQGHLRVSQFPFPTVGPSISTCTTRKPSRGAHWRSCSLHLLLICQESLSMAWQPLSSSTIPCVFPLMLWLFQVTENK